MTDGIIHEKRVETKIVGEFPVRVFGGSHVPEVDHLDVEKSLGVCGRVFHEGADEMTRHPASRADEKLVPATYMGECPFRGREFFRVSLPQFDETVCAVAFHKFFLCMD